MPIFRRENRRRGVPAELRELVVTAVLRNPLSEITDPSVRDRMLAGEDVTFDELGLDSLARLTLATDLDAAGYPISEVEVNEAGSVEGLARLLIRVR
jgi:hypothetical protein